MGAQRVRRPKNSPAIKGWQSYGLIFVQHRHQQGKAPPFTIESHNHRRRGYLARRRHKTHCDTKSHANLAASILLYLHQKFSQHLMSNPQK